MTPGGEDPVLGHSHSAPGVLPTPIVIQFKDYLENGQDPHP